MIVRDEAQHILLHVNAEEADSDPSQLGDVAGRASYIRNALASFLTASRDLSREAVLTAISDAAPGGAPRLSFRRALSAMRGDDGIRLQLAIQTWVRTGGAH